MGDPCKARVKPENSLVQLEYPINSRSKFYDHEADDCLKTKTQTLDSQHIPALSNYAIGVLREGQLHLTPIHSVQQMRPSFRHIDEAVGEEGDIYIYIYIYICVYRDI